MSGRPEYTFVKECQAKSGEIRFIARKFSHFHPSVMPQHNKIGHCQES